MNLSIRQKLVLGCGLLATFPVIVAAQAGWSAASIARLLLGTVAVGGLAWWVVRARGLEVGSAFKQAPRLVVLQRVGLSPRNGLALVEVDGRPFIVVHGDGFARIRPAPRRVRVTLPKSGVTP